MRSKIAPIIAVASSLCLFLFLAIAGRTTALKKKSDASETNEASVVITDDVLLAGARSSLDSAQLQFVLELDRKISTAKNTEEEVLILKLLSKTWNEYGNFSVGGYYAEKIAGRQNTAESWAIAGSTFGIAFNKEKTDLALRKYLGNKSIQAFQKAYSIEPDSFQHALNEAVMIVDVSMVDSKIPPMTGAQKLLALDKKHPNQPLIQLHLGRLSFTRSGDINKAIPRFEKVLELSKNQPVDQTLLLESHYSLAECYKKRTNKEKVIYHLQECIKLSSANPEVQRQLKLSLEIFEKEGK